VFLENILTQRLLNKGLSFEQKQLVLEEMKRTGSFDFTLAALRTMMDEIKAEVARIERQTSVCNLDLQLIIELLNI
jgi:hypothetical protein